MNIQDSTIRAMIESMTIDELEIVGRLIVDEIELRMKKVEEVE